MDAQPLAATTAGSLYPRTPNEQNGTFQILYTGPNKKPPCKVGIGG